ncbi:unnamed protein product [Clonostachys byssicola]|uniref:Major facilitator superfamily (MFS) profile domain-containing protein n=1 Tax=Clonostachys byssicola TaxID=160290 RepID=A0A9N9XZY7_9HYPO|nr:unnamed protein product [Clonostachys byssicola]
MGVADETNKSSDGVEVSNITNNDGPTAVKKGQRFWITIVALGFAGLLTALEATITSTAMPSIIAELGGGNAYIWAINGYLVALTSLQPLFGQLGDVFGRKWPMVAATALFVLGSGLCGGASNMTMMIAGRVIQGVGASGINVFIEVIICDLLPLRERGKYMAIIFGLVSVGTALGPFFGGLIVDSTTWRWVFYMILPIGAVALFLLTLVLPSNFNRDTTLASKLKKLDWTGNVIFIAAVSSIFIALAWAGVVYSWKSYQILVPLLVGFAGLAGFLVFEASRFAEQPMMPLRLLSNRTSAAVYLITFFHAIISMWTLYFLPVYFQGVLGSSPRTSGLQLLATILVMVPAAATGGVLLSKFGAYIPIHYISTAIAIIGFGLFTLLDENSSAGAWIGFQIIEAIGMGVIIPTLLPAILAPLTDADTGLATGTWSFFRSFGMSWGTAIPAAIFNNRFDELAGSTIADETLRAQVTGGRAYEHATAAFLKTLSGENRTDFIATLDQSLRRTWQVGLGFSVIVFLFVFMEKKVALRNELDTEYGFKEKVDIGSTSSEEAKA